MDGTSPGDSAGIPGPRQWARARLHLALLAMALAPAPAAASHPALFYSDAERQQLRQRSAGTHAPIYDALRRGTEYFLGSTVSSSGRVTWPGTPRTFDLGDRRDIGNALVVFAFVSDLADDVSYFALARDWLMAVVGFGGFDLDGTHDLVQSHLLAGVAVAYD